MSRRLLALAASVLLVPLLAAPAGAAPTPGPATPSLAQVAAIYPELAGGTAHVDHADAPGIGPDCDDGDPIPGARATFTEYDVPEPDSFDSFLLVFAGAVTFRSARDASAYLRDFRRATADCFDLGRGSTTTRIRFRVGQERVGLEVTTRVRRMTSVSQILLARTGRVLALASVNGYGDTAPTADQAVRLTALTLRTAR